MQAGRGKRSALLSTAMLSHPPIDTCPVGLCKTSMKVAFAKMIILPFELYYNAGWLNDGRVL